MQNRRPSVGVGVMLLRDNHVLLGKRHSDPTKALSALHGAGTWTMPGGKLDFGEEITDAACRELHEETGIRITPTTLQLVSVRNHVVEDAHFVTLGFVCVGWDGKPEVREPDEITEWRFFPLTDLPTPMYFPSSDVIKDYQSGRVFQIDQSST